MYLAFFASNIVLAGQSLHGIAEPFRVRRDRRRRRSECGLICVIGYRLVHT